LGQRSSPVRRAAKPGRKTRERVQRGARARPLRERPRSGSNGQGAQDSKRMPMTEHDHIDHRAIPLFEELTWPEVDAAAKAEAPLITGLGETGGPGLPLPLGTDTYQGLDMCRRAAAVLKAESIDLVVGPAIPFGPPPFLSESPRSFPGTIV